MQERSCLRISRPTWRCRGERGNALVEAAVVTPLIMMLVLGLVEFAMLAKDNMTISNGSRAGARVASAAGKDPLADYNVLKAVQGATGGMATVEQVIVYKATSPTGAVPSSCLSGAVAATCNVYDASDLAISQATFESGAYTKDDSWAAPTRVTSQSAPGGPDYLGVYVKGTHNSVTHLILDSRTVKDDVIMRLEPSL